MVTLARPELLERRPTWGAGQRSFTSLYLEPLSQQAMEELLAGLVPGLPAEVRDRILARAEGIPLYAVETVRMLLDRGLLVQDGAVYRPTGPIEALEVPETLHALIAARLDGLSAEERRLLQDAAVLGKTFTQRRARRARGLPTPSSSRCSPSLVRKEVLGVQADPRSPEHGQYGFLQDLVRHVAYETLSKRERRARHLAAAAYLSAAFADDEDEVVEVDRLALPRRLRGRAGRGRRRRDQGQGAGDARAGRRARRVARAQPQRRGATSSRRRSSTEDPSERAALLDRAGEMAATSRRSGRGAPAPRASRSRSTRQQGDTHAAARVLVQARRGSTSSRGVATRR